MTTTKTFCRICEAACGLEVSHDGRELKIKPDRDHPVSHGFVCAKGTRFAEVASHPARILAPCLREGGVLRETTWDRANAEVGARLRSILDRHGPHSVAFYIGNPLAFHALGQITALALARAIGTRNVFTAGSQDCSNKFAASSIMHGTPVIHPIPDFERAELAVLLGTNPLVSQSSFVHLEGGATIFDRMSARGAKIVWVDVRRTESAKRWGEYVAIRPGTDVFLILALLGLFADRVRKDDRVEGLDRLLALAREITPARASAITGVPAEKIEELARAIERAKGTAFHMSVGVNQGPFGTLSYIALQALAYASGNYDREGGSLFSPIGVLAAKIARAAGMFTSKVRSRIGDFPIVFDGLPGGVLADEILTEGPERVRALIVIAGDPLRSIPGAARLERAMRELDLCVAIDLFESETGRFADAILPVTSFLERADLALPGLPLQTTDLWQTTPRVLDRMGETRPEHEIFAELSLAIDRPIFGAPSIARWIAHANTDRAITAVTELAWKLFDRDPARRGYGIRIPAPRPESYLGRGPLTPSRRVRFWSGELDGEPERLFAAERSIAERSSAQTKGFLLLGRRRRIGHNSWLHGGTRGGELEGEAWLSPSDLDELGIADGAMVELRTEAGSARLPVRGREGVERGTIVVPHGEIEVNVNALIPSGPRFIEPLSGMCLMTGVPVEIARA